jgi:hypothetical protein
MADHFSHHEKEGAPIEYLKFAGIIIAILLLAWLYASWQGLTVEIYMRGFMGVFFIVFGIFKLLDLPGFVMSYIGYDLIAHKTQNYWLCLCLSFYRISFGLRLFIWDYVS